MRPFVKYSSCHAYRIARHGYLISRITRQRALVVLDEQLDGFSFSSLEYISNLRIVMNPGQVCQHSQVSRSRLADTPVLDRLLYRGLDMAQSRTKTVIVNVTLESPFPLEKRERRYLSAVFGTKSHANSKRLLRRCTPVPIVADLE